MTEAITMSEKRLQDSIVRIASETDWYVYHTHIAKRGAEGYPDLTMANNRLMRHLWVELKREMRGHRLVPTLVRQKLAGPRPVLFTGVPGRVRVANPTGWHARW